jgi:hypothetical protein
VRWLERSSECLECINKGIVCVLKQVSLAAGDTMK